MGNNYDGEYNNSVFFFFLPMRTCKKESCMIIYTFKLIITD